LIVFRLLIGWGVGVGSAVTPVYIGEIATSGLRGALGAANQLSVTIGIFFVNAVGTYGFTLTEGDDQFVNWRSICLLNAAIALALLPVSVMPESPKWLAGKGRSDDAKKALGRLRAGDSSMEADQMVAEVCKQSSTEAGSNSPGLRAYPKSLVIALGCQLFQQLSGVNAVMMYTSAICKQAGVEDSNSAAMIVMGAQVILTGISCLLMERAGRRALLLFGSTCMTIGTLLLAYYFLAQDLKFWGPSYIALVGLSIFIVGFSLGLGPIPWLLVAEIFPTEVRGLASSVATATNWAASFLVTLSFSHLQTAITKEGTFLMFSVICGCCFAFVMTKVPETKGKSVDDVLAVLQGGARNVPVEARAGTA
jgi:SP family facilitated glucose transporter-like MFS transporter 8